MKLAAVAACVLLAAAPSCLAADDVFVATGANIDKLLTSNPFVLMEFYASWCGHCKSLAPEYEKAAAALKGSDPPIVLAKMEATEEGNKEAAAKYGVKGYPTLKIFRGDPDTPQEYNGPREADGIVSFLKKQAGPAYDVLKSADAVTAYKQKEAAVLGVFKPASAQEKVFLKVADQLREDLDFAVATAAEGLSAPSVVLYKQYDDKELVYEGKLEAPALSAWLTRKAQPLVPQLDQSPRNSKAVQAMFANPSVRIVGVATKGKKSGKAFDEALGASARENEDYRHLFIDGKANAQALSFFGLVDADLPAWVIHDASAKGDDKYIAKKAKAAALEGFIADFKAGKLERHVKSEEPPEYNDGPVKVVTAKTFDEMVFQSGKYSLLEFYAPWCGHCKSLAPIYEEVGKAFSKNKSVSILKCDATANDVPSQFEVSGFPTLKLVTPDGTIVPYSGDRSQDDLIQFVEKAVAGAGSGVEAGAAYDEEL